MRAFRRRTPWVPRWAAAPWVAPPQRDEAAAAPEAAVGTGAGARRYARLLDLRARRIGVTLAGRTVEFVDWGYYAPSPWRNYLHSHSYFEVCHVYEGEGRFSSQDAEFTVGPGVTFV